MFDDIKKELVKKFIADKKATQKEQDLVDNYIDEIKLNKGVNNE